MRVTLMTATITKAWIAMLQTLAAAPTRYCRNMGLPPALRPFCLVDDVISAIDIHDAAGYQLCAVERQKGRRRADVVDAYKASCGSLGLRLIHQIVEFGDTRTRACCQRPRGNPAHPHPFTTDLAPHLP